MMTVGDILALDADAIGRLGNDELAQVRVLLKYACYPVEAAHVYLDARAHLLKLYGLADAEMRLRGMVAYVGRSTVGARARGD